MATAPTFTKTGAKATKNAQLSKDVFGVEVTNHELLKQVYAAYEAGGRTNAARTKNRAQVRGGGRKPWRQKGTGNARAGSIRSPIWRGGGITFGPTGIESYRKKVNASANGKALKQALSLKATAKAVVVVESIDIKEGKTKDLKKLLDKLKIERNVVIVVAEKNDMLYRAAANLPSASVVTANYLNVKTVLDSDTLLVTSDGVKKLEERAGGKK